jgi:hypothetical protein
VVRAAGRLLLGPLSLPGWGARVAGLLLTVVLTLLTQVGGVLLWPAWGAVWSATEGMSRGRAWARCGLMLAVYLLGTQALLPLIAARTGRVRLPAFATADTPLGPLVLATVLLNRGYVRPHTRDAVLSGARAAAAHEPGLVVRYLDAGFPFPWPPLLPHLSHGDGQRVDLSLHWSRDGQPVGGARSPIGYLGYAEEGGERPECAGVQQVVAGVPVDLRWDVAWLQPLLPARDLDVGRTRAMLRGMAGQPHVCSVLLEPTLHSLLAAPKLAANGCGVARHDDHVHVTTRTACR